MQYSKPSHTIFHIFIIILCLAPFQLRAAEDSVVVGSERRLDSPVLREGRSQVLGSPRALKKNDSEKLRKKNALVPVRAEEEKPLSFLVHGAKALREGWYKPGGDFYEELSAQARLAGLGEVVPVSWSGKSGPPEGRLASVRAHIKAAKDLVETIRQRTKGSLRELILIGHSNGGVISMVASHMLFNPSRQRRTQELFDNLPESDSNYRLLIECREEISAAVEEQQLRWTQQDPVFVIKQLFTIATPVDTVLYTANMSVVKKMYVLFSAGDGIQRFFGKRHYPKGKGALNIRVAMESANGGIFYPWHTRMRNTLMARHLPGLPLLIEKEFGSNLTQYKGIDVLLSQRSVPPKLKIIDSFAKRSFQSAGF